MVHDESQDAASFELRKGELMDILSVLKSKMDEASLEKLTALNNSEVNAFVARAIELCGPEKVWVGTDCDEDVAYCRQLAIDNK